MVSEKTQPPKPSGRGVRGDPRAPSSATIARIRSAQVAESAEIVRDLGRARTLMRHAASGLIESFNHLSDETLGQQSRIQHLLVDMSGAVRDDGTEGLNIASFVNKTASVLQSFADVLVHFSKQSITISYKIDDMVEHMDRIFDLVSQVDSIAEETNILAINAALEAARAEEAGKGFKVVASEIRMLSMGTKALNEQIGTEVDAARTVIDAVSEASRDIASQDMSIALTAKGSVDEMLVRLQHIDAQLTKTLDDVADFTQRVRENTNSAIRSMQFEDMVGQILEQLEQRAERLPSLLDASEDGLPELDELARRVEQNTMEAGDVELF